MDILIGFEGACVLGKSPNRGANVKNAHFVLEDLIQNGHSLFLQTNLEKGVLNESLNWFYEKGLKVKVDDGKPKDLIISVDTQSIPLKFNELISTEPFVDWQKMRIILEDKKFL